jgi:uncharacterized protein YbjT (DUF2867 family)
MSILIIGATGKVGELLTRQLHAKGAPIVVLARDIAKTEKMFPGVRVVHGDVDKVETVKAALVGVERLFLLTVNPLVEGAIAREAKAAGVKQLVKLSCIHASTSAEPGSFVQQHGLAEMQVAQSGIPWVMLRPHDFMQNLTGSASTIKSMNKFFGAFEQAAISSIDASDIAASAAAVLTSPPEAHNYRGYTLTGPAALTKTELAAALSTALGRTIEYVEIGDVAFKGALMKAGIPEAYAHPLMVLCQFYRQHCTGHRFATGNVELLTGRKPRSWNDFLVENRGAF